MTSPMLNTTPVQKPASRPAAKPKIESLDIYRALAISAVIIIHVTSNPVVRMRQRPDSLLAIFYDFWNRFSQFAVPSFVFLSGLVLFYNYWDPERPRRGWVAGFYKKRLLYIFVPYVVWSFVYFLMVQSEKGNAPFDHMKQFLGSLLTGNNYEHLYYFVMLIQYYVLFPLLLFILQKKHAARFLIPFAVLFQTAFYFLNNKVLHWPSGDIFATYFLLFSLGALAGMNYERVTAVLSKWLWLLLPAFILSGLAFVFASKLYYEWEPRLIPYKMYFNFGIYYLFTASACLSLLIIANGLFRLLNNSWLARFLSGIGAASFAIFLVHPLFLHYWRLEAVNRYGAYYHYLTWLGAPVILLLSLGFYKLLRRWKWSWILIGR